MTPVEDEKVKVEGEIKVSVLYKTDEEEAKVCMCHGEIPFTATMDIKGIEKDMKTITRIELESLDASIEANTIAIKATISACVKVFNKVKKEWIVDIIEGNEEKKEKDCSVKIYVVNKGDTLWELAKKFNTTIDELVNINEMDSTDSLSVGKKIIIPGRAIF